MRRSARGRRGGARAPPVGLGPFGILYAGGAGGGAGGRRSMTVTSGKIRGGGGTGISFTNSRLVPRTSFWNLLLWETSTRTDALQQAKPTFALNPTLMFVSDEVVVLMSIVTSMDASANW